MSGSAAIPPAVGELAPVFQLPSTNNRMVSLTSLYGESTVLLAFFPAAFTDVCTAEMCDLSIDVAKFDGVNAAVVGISVDSIPALLEFKAKHRLDIELLSDVRREVTRSYGVLNDEYYCAQRSYFIVGTDGRVKWMHVERSLDDKRDNTDLLAVLAGFD